MKRILSLMLAAAMMFSFAACGKKTDKTDMTEQKQNETGDNGEQQDILTDDDLKPDGDGTAAESDDNTAQEEQKPQQTTKPSTSTNSTDQTKPSTSTGTTAQTKPSVPSADQKPVVAPEPTTPPTEEKPAEKSLGQTLQAVFKNHMSDNPSSTPEEAANAVLANEALRFASGTYAVTPGYLNGFDAEISGFSEGVCFGPIIGSIPFIGYVFTVSEDTTVDAFVTTLKDNANRRWNICTEADETVVDSAGSTVFFLMCPTNMDE